MEAKAEALDTPTDGSRGERRLHDFLLATLIGLSWFLLAQGSFRLAQALALGGYVQNSAWWPILSSTRLVIGLAVYVPVGLLVAGGACGSRLVALGLLSRSRLMVARVAALVAVAVAYSGPGAVWSHLVAHFDGGVLKVLGGVQPAVVEELLIRGIVWAVLARSFSTGFTLMWSTALFWTWHWEFGLGASAINMGYSILAFGLPRIATGLIWPGMVFHLLGSANCGQFLGPPVALISAVLIWVDRRKSRGGLTRG